MKHLMMAVLIAAFAWTVHAQPQYEPHTIWQRAGAGDSSLYGTEILALGDQNNDGYNDWAIYAAGLGYAPPGSPNEPKVEFFHGGNPPDTVPYMVRVADRATEVAVRGARALGDLNGDGYVDWYIFTSYVGDSTGRHIYKIYFGGPGPHDVPDLILTSPILSGYDPIGDFNGDGFDDVLLSDGHNYRAAIFYGGNPMDTVSDWVRNVYLGGAFAGNANGDRFSDFISLAYGGAVDLFLGAQHPDTVAAYHWAEYINLPAILPDINGDGIGDLAFGVAGGTEIRFGGSVIHSSSDDFLHFPGCSPQRVASAGDFNHDGFGDVVMLAEWCQDSWYGTLTVHLGGSWLNPDPDFVIYGWTSPLNLIHFKTAICLGDINGDHADDLAIGANGGIEYLAQRGKTVILAGDTSLHAAVDPEKPQLPYNLHVSVYPNPFNSECSVSLALPYYNNTVELRLCNILGQQVQTAMLRNVSGKTVHRINGSNLPSGLYLLRVSSGSLQSTTKLVLLR
jgi:hypothetical protein